MSGRQVGGDASGEGLRMVAVAGHAEVRTGRDVPSRASGDEHGSVPGLDATEWGWILRSGSPLRRTALRMAEAATGATGLALVLVALAHWVVPGAILSGGVLGHKAAVTAFLVMSGLLLLRYAGQGFQTEVHLDRERGELRIVACNRAREVRLLDSLAFAEIAALEVARSGEGTTRGAVRGRLLVHLVHGDAPLTLVSGPAARLSPVAATFARDIEQATRHARPGPADTGGDLGRVSPDFA
jgi:hypothetical protein